MKKIELKDLINLADLSNKEKVKLASELLLEVALNTGFDAVNYAACEMAAFAKFQMNHSD